MAMLEHGLPVLVTRPCGRYRSLPDGPVKPEIANVIDHFEGLASLKKSMPRSRLGEIAEQFADDLKNAAAA